MRAFGFLWRTLQILEFLYGSHPLKPDHLPRGRAGDDLLHEISLEINAQERVGLIGPNGCGKRTLLRMIRGEVMPASGEIYRSDEVDTAGYLSQYTPPSS